MKAAHVNRYRIAVDGETGEIGTANELAIALDVLQGQHDRAVLAQLAPHLAEIIQHPAGFSLVLRSLSPQDQLYFIDQMGVAMTGVIRDARHLRDLFAVMSEIEVEERILDTLGAHGLRTLISTGTELAQVLEWLYGQCDRRLLALLGMSHICWIIRNARQLGQVLNSLDQAGQGALIEILGWTRIVELVSDGRDLAILLRALPPSESVRLIDYYAPERLVALIGNRQDWAYLYGRLEPLEADLIFNKLGVHRHAE